MANDPDRTLAIVEQLMIDGRALFTKVETLERRVDAADHTAKLVATQLRSLADAIVESYAPSESLGVGDAVNTLNAAADAIDPAGGQTQWALCPNCGDEKRILEHPTIEGFAICVDCGHAFAEQDVDSTGPGLGAEPAGPSEPPTA